MRLSSERDLGVELLQSVDGIVVSWTILSLHLMPSLLPALTSSVTIAVVTFAVWSIALVWRGLERVLVGLHDIKLWTPLAVDLVGITVVVAPATARWIAVPVLGRHQNEIEGSIATTA